MKFKRIAILVTFFGLWLSVYFSEPSQEIFAFLSIFSVGILHGSNDLGLIARLKSSSTRRGLLYFFATYIGTVFFASLLFYYLPILALIAFVLFSAFHFGEQHWVEQMDAGRGIYKVFFLTYGMAILFLLFYLNDQATNEVIYSLTGFSFSKSFFLWVFLALLAFIVVALIRWVRSKVLHWEQLVFELFLFLVFAIVFNTATLIWAFALYFIFWHSVPSIQAQLSFLYGETTFKAFWKYLRSSLLIWTISFGSMIGLYYLIRDDQQLFLPVFFAFLGAITFAHSFIMTTMFKRKSLETGSEA